MAARPERHPTIRDVAALAGVSKSLVSLVLNDSPLVRPAKRAAVEAAVRELGYRPNSAARRLTGSSLGTVGVLIHDLRQPFHEDMVEALNVAFHARDMTMLLGDAMLDRRADQRLVNAFVNMRVDGLVLVGSMTPSEDVVQASLRLPTVVVASLDLVRPRVDLAVQDDAAGARLATEHLVDLGHRRIAHVAGSYGVAISDRRASFEAVVAEHGLSGRARVVTEDLTESGGYRAAVQLLEVPVADRPTAIFAAADTVGVGVLRAASDLGIRVPEDLSVVGFDNASVSARPGVELTTVDIELRHMAESTVDLLRERIEQPQRRRRVRRTTPSLVVRRSSGRPSVGTV
jgi:DNA-binding LacI/PurR family transcriptional regulator